MDFGFGSESEQPSYENNTLAYASSTGGDINTNPEWSTFVFRKLLGNEKFRINFINRFADLMNTTYIPQRVNGIIDEMKSGIAAEILQHGKRWQSFTTLSNWEGHIQTLVEFANHRREFQRNHIREKFGIDQNIDVTLQVNDNAAGSIAINTITIAPGTDGIVQNPYPWTGVYFSGIPVVLKAVPKSGYVFSHWEGASESTEPEITLTRAESYSITAVFVPDGPVETNAPLYFWMMDGSIPNNLPLQSLSSTFEANGIDGSMDYESCLTGYPFTAEHPNWRKASMERRNSPTAMNYIPEANNNLLFADSDMKAIQIREPLHFSGLQNTMIFNFSTSGYKNVSFSFAALNEGTNANAISVEYAVNAGMPEWITSLQTTTFPLTDAYQVFALDFSEIETINNNPNFKLRVRFTGSDMEVDAGNRITFNNVAVHASQTVLGLNAHTDAKFSVYPNPFLGEVTITGATNAGYKIFSIDGKLIKTGILTAAKLPLNELSKGIYLLQLTSDGTSEMKKIIKR